MERLILFDIDGTLVHCGLQVRVIFAEALIEVFGTAGSIDSYDFAGRTDRQIISELMAEAGFPGEEVEERLPRMRELYVDELEARLDVERMRLLPGVLDLLERLERRAGYALGLLTGNFEPGARIKLGRFDLNRFLPFGAFGDDHVDRVHLVEVARAAAEERTGVRFADEQILLIGDSLLDVRCARENNVRCLAVATGGATAEELGAAGADQVIADLTAAEIG